MSIQRGPYKNACRIWSKCYDGGHSTKKSRWWLHHTLKNGQCFDATVVASIFDHNLQKVVERKTTDCFVKWPDLRPKINIRPAAKTQQCRQNVGCIFPRLVDVNIVRWWLSLAGWRLPHSLQNLSLKSGSGRLDFWWGRVGVPWGTRKSVFSSWLKSYFLVSDTTNRFLIAWLTLSCTLTRLGD